MYCSSCGVAVAQNLTYCNHCGSKVNSDKGVQLDKATEVRAEWAMMTSMGALFVCGLVAIAILLGVMKSVLIFQEGPIMAFGFLSFLILIALEAVYVSRLLRFRRDTGKAAELSSSERHTKELEARSRIVSEPVGSVTDHTTRTLDPVYNGQNPER